MLNALVVLVCLFLGGLPLAFALTRQLLPAVLLAPLAAALTGSAAVGLMLLAGGPLLLWCGIALAGQLALAYGLSRRDRPVFLVDPWWVSAVVAGVLLLPFLTIKKQPTGWDSHSIWWLHAGYFRHGGEAARQAIANPAYAFSHVDYPPLTSGTVAAVWSILGQVDFRVAQLIVAVLNFSAIVLSAYAVRTVTVRGNAVVSWIAATGVALATWALLPYGATDGYSDVLCSVSVVAAAVLLLLGRDPLARPGLAMLLMTVAALTKNEGLVAVLIVAGVATLRNGRGLLRWRTPEGRRHLGRVALLWWPVAAGLSWMVIVRALGGQSDLASQGRFDDLLRGDLGVRHRLGSIVTAYEPLIGVTVLLAVVVAVAGAVFLRPARRRLDLGSDGWLWIVLAAQLLVLTFTYLITPYDLGWHLGTSARRVLLPVVLLAMTSAAVWAVVAGPAARADRITPVSPARPAALEDSAAPR
ncbi:hypothetical protein HDA40_005148 [Hamadaea flava]|uniref:Glycosyltransferase RgtA/B/C/D-like domain-containing protein n=1 Tax=Hamadaea flava TaxID=1742688 RepID=A0ABV8LHX9_9ACTN|nr:hypothetical protein [Hamadaea flava]MCP2326641.1 hypothetical protein [Hamadaea flava]